MVPEGSSSARKYDFPKRCANALAFSSLSWMDIPIMVRGWSDVFCFWLNASRTWASVRHSTHQDAQKLRMTGVFTSLKRIFWFPSSCFTSKSGAGFPINGDGTFFGSVLNPKAKMAINPAIEAHEIQKPGLFQSFFFHEAPRACSEALNLSFRTVSLATSLPGRWRKQIAIPSVKIGKAIQAHPTRGLIKTRRVTESPDSPFSEEKIR